jgi:hypothetical protein
MTEQKTRGGRALRFVVSGALLVGPAAVGCEDAAPFSDPPDTVNEPAPPTPPTAPTPNNPPIEEPHVNEPAPPPPPGMHTVNEPAPEVEEEVDAPRPNVPAPTEGDER